MALTAEDRRLDEDAGRLKNWERCGPYLSDRPLATVTAEYAKASPDDILIRLTVANRSPMPARLHLLPTFWFRNTWSWRAAYDEGRWPKPRLTRADDRSLVAVHATLGRFRLTAGDLPNGRQPEFLFTENERNTQRLFGSPNVSPYFKLVLHHYTVDGRRHARRREPGPSPPPTH